MTWEIEESHMLLTMTNFTVLQLQSVLPIGKNVFYVGLKLMTKEPHSDLFLAECLLSILF